MHQSPQRQSRPRLEFGATDRAVVVDVGSLELPLHQSEELVLVHGAVMIAIGPAEFLGGHAATAELGAAELAGVAAIQTIEQLPGGVFCFLEIDSAIGITVDTCKGAGPPAPARERRGHRDAAGEPEQQQLPPQGAFRRGGNSSLA